VCVCVCVCVCTFAILLLLISFGLFMYRQSCPPQAVFVLLDYLPSDCYGPANEEERRDRRWSKVVEKDQKTLRGGSDYTVTYFSTDNCVIHCCAIHVKVSANLAAP
jgi:hypothetical protein